MRWVFMLQVTSTLLMTGIIWFVQIVHYPLFRVAGEERFPSYAAFHATRTGWVVAPVMLTELVTALVLCLNRQTFASACGLLLLVVIWASTASIQVPLHSLLAKGFNAQAIDRLVRTNWIRTIAWTLRAVLVFWWLRTA